MRLASTPYQQKETDGRIAVASYRSCSVLPQISLSLPVSLAPSAGMITHVKPSGCGSPVKDAVSMSRPV